MNAGARPGEVDVVILTWNDGELLNTALASVLATETIEANVFVIDNASDPPASVPAAANVRLVRNEENRGVSAGRNQGVALGRAELVCMLDSDAEFGPESLQRLVVPFSDSTIGVTVPVFADQQPSESAGKAPTLWVKIQRGLNRRSDYEPMPHDRGAAWWDVDFGIGACQVFRRDVFEKLGGLDESIFFGPEDVDFCLRVKEAGWRVVQVADASVIHPPRRAFRNPMSVRGLRHAWSLVRHFWRLRGRRRGE